MKKFQAEELFTPYNELCKFCDEYALSLELDKPFQEFNELILKVIDPDGNVVKKITLDDIAIIQKESGKLLNNLAKESKSWL